MKIRVGFVANSSSADYIFESREMRSRYNERQWSNKPLRSEDVLTDEEKREFLEEEQEDKEFNDSLGKLSPRLRALLYAIEESYEV